MEWLSELIGFFILVLLFVVPLLRKLLIDKKRVEQEPEQELMPVEEESFEASYERPITERLVKKDFEFESEVTERELDAHLRERELGTRVAPEFKERIVSDAFILESVSRQKRRDVIGEIVRGSSPERAMVILSEVLGKPKGLE